MKRGLITFEDMNPESMTNLYEHAFIVDKICKIAGEVLKKETFLMLEYYFEGQHVLYEDIKEKKVEYISQLIDDYFKFSEFYSKGEVEEKFLEFSASNSLYYYPNLNVIVCDIVVLNGYGGRSSCFSVFANNKEDLEAYMNYVTARSREHSKNHITIYTDGADGKVDKKIERITRSISREDVIINEDLKTKIFRPIEQFFNGNGEFYKKYNIPYKRGILLYGRPGNGKTTLIKSIVNTIDAPVVYWQVTEFTSSESIQTVFESVAKKAPVILVIEDLDSIPERVRSIFLNALDGVASKEGIFIVGTTNYPEKIDEALMNRAGRFDHAYEIDKPASKMRKQYLEKKNILDLIDKDQLDLIIKHTEGLSMSILNELYTSIALQIHYEGEVNVIEICDSLNDNTSKQKKNKFFKEDESSRVGFSIV